MSEHPPSAEAIINFGFASPQRGIFTKPILLPGMLHLAPQEILMKCPLQGSAAVRFKDTTTHAWKAAVSTSVSVQALHLTGEILSTSPHRAREKSGI